jgi:hypothetical protein
MLAIVRGVCHPAIGPSIVRYRRSLLRILPTPLAEPQSISS